jgi:hypothetical protein
MDRRIFFSIPQAEEEILGIFDPGQLENSELNSLPEKALAMSTVSYLMVK